ncbi:MAG TPA: Gfo/Idh/MocA family oxidoreductase [Chthonomonadales bacterium]|nr:Gfo/Idh/MocA family oxidoreductase [Chthonomonadales bacterium]
MAKEYRLGVASMVHDHVWGELEHWRSQPNVRIVAAADVNAELRARARATYGVERVYDSWRQMLEREELDIVQAASENSVAADIVEAAAARGLHVVSEKPMSATFAQAERMVAAAQSAGTRLLINWPTAWSPAIQEMERRIVSGEIGEVFYFKQRSAHNGPKEIGCSRYFWEWLYDEELNGAGALMDYCCYSADMCARFLGLPQQVTGFRGVLAKDYPLPDDNAIIVMRYPKAFGVAEASWTQTVGYATPNPVAYGTGGSIAVSGSHVVIELPEREAEKVQAPQTVAPMRNAPEYLLHCLKTGEPISGFCSMEVSRDAQMILEGGKRSADTGQAVSLPLSV